MQTDKSMYTYLIIFIYSIYYRYMHVRFTDSSFLTYARFMPRPEGATFTSLPCAGSRSRVFEDYLNSRHHPQHHPGIQARCFR